MKIEAVRESVGEILRTSFHHCGQELQISRSSLHCILTKHLCLHAYIIQLTHQLMPNDNEQQRVFLEQIIKHQQMNADLE